MTVSLIERRVIEAQALAPLVRALGEELGLDKVKAVLQAVNERASREYGQELAQRLGSNTLADLAREMSSWGQGGVLEEEVLEQSQTVYAFNVTRCLYAEKYAELGLADLGYCLSCCRDEPFAQGFNPGIVFTRTRTIMEGAPICDFRYTLNTEPD